MREDKALERLLKVLLDLADGKNKGFQRI